MESTLNHIKKELVKALEYNKASKVGKHYSIEISQRQAKEILNHFKIDYNGNRKQ